jgi:uncharacterized protein (DUF58 family)
MIPREILKKIRQIELRTNRIVTETLAGQYHSVFKGQGMNFDEVREYQPGDDVRAIDWNVTARMNHPFIKKFVEERELTLMLVVDVSGSGLFGSRDQSKRELAAEIASVLAFSAIRNNDKVGLILFSDEVEKFIPPRKGRSHVLRVIREVLFFEPKRRGTDLNEALEFLGRVQAHKAITVIISDFLGRPSRARTREGEKRRDAPASANDAVAGIAGAGVVHRCCGRRTASTTSWRCKSPTARTGIAGAGPADFSGRRDGRNCRGQHRRRAQARCVCGAAGESRSKCAAVPQGGH